MQSIVAKTLVKLSIQNTTKTDDGIMEAYKYDSCDKRFVHMTK